MCCLVIQLIDSTRVRPGVPSVMMLAFLVLLQAVVADAQATVLSNGVADNSVLAAAGQSKFYQLLLSRNVCTCRLNACLLPQCPNTWALMGQPYVPNARRRPCPTCGSCSRASAETLTCMCR